MFVRSLSLIRGPKKLFAIISVILFNPCNVNVRAELNPQSVKSVVKKGFTVFGLRFTVFVFVFVFVSQMLILMQS